MSKFWVLVGSFTPLITTLQFTTSPPSLSFVSQATSGTSPSWLAQSPKAPTTIYATDEVLEAGSINSLTLDPATGNLTHVANVPTKGGAPTHLGFINQGATLGAAHFANGSAFFVDLATPPTGQFTGTGSLLAFNGSGPLPNQATPHAHQIVQYRDEVLVPDLGSDKIWRLAQEGNSFTLKGS